MAAMGQRAALRSAAVSPSSAALGVGADKLAAAVERLSVSASSPRMPVMMSRKCQLTGKKANNAMQISFSHIRTHKLQQVNLQWKRVFWEEGNRWVRLRLSTKAIKTIDKIGLDAVAKKNGIDLSKLV